MSKRAPKDAFCSPGPDDRTRTWTIIAPADHELSDVLHPEYFGLRAGQLREHDGLNIRSVAHKFLVRGIVIAVHEDDGAIDFIAYEIVDLTALPTIAPDYAGATCARQAGSWVVVLDGRVIKKGFANEASAQEWLAAR